MGSFEIYEKIKWLKISVAGSYPLNESELRMDRDEWENEAINHYYMFWESHMKHSRMKATQTSSFTSI